MELRAGEPDLVAAILCGNPPVSRNRQYDLLSSDVGRKARRRAAFLRSIARDIESARATRGVVTVERGEFARGEVRVIIHNHEFTRRAYLTREEIVLVTRVFPLVARVLDVTAEA